MSMNYDELNNTARDAKSRVRRALPRKRSMGMIGGAIPVLLGIALVALRFDAVRTQLYKLLPQSRKFVDRWYGHGDKMGGDRHLGGHERTPYGEA